MKKGSDDAGEATTFQATPSPTPLPAEATSLPIIALEVGPSDAEFQLEETLGQGGVGRVLSARQRALQRSVAVKFLKNEDGDEAALLREAIVMGRLEHPNIVPVHVLGRTAVGVAFFSMKRVEGTPWSEALRGTKSVVEHLEVLQRVCDAVAFAHSRNVIHRDIKPANVLIGSFGEVYLGDWGLAAALRADTVLPLAADAGVGGTPAYLAPEMASGSRELGPWTDVFLLGATLYEVLTGRPPWVADSVAEVIALAAAANDPPIDPRVPAELASICRRAMQKNPAARFESAQSFKEAITGYLRHREALELHERALMRLAELEREMSGSTLENSAYGLSAQRLFTECRFAFEQVRKLWPEFEPARSGLRDAVVLMVRHELARGVPQAARVLLSELVVAPPELAAAVDEAEQREREKAARLTALEQQAKNLSADAARAPKAVYAYGVAAATLAASVVAQGLESTGVHHFTAREGLVFSVVLALNGLLYALWVSRLAEANELQARISQALVGLGALSVLCWWAAVQYGVDFRFSLLGYYALQAAGWWVGGALVEPRARNVAAGFALASALGAVFPEYVYAGGAFVAAGYGLLARSLSGAKSDRVDGLRERE